MDATGGSCAVVVDPSRAGTFHVGEPLLADDGRWYCPHDAVEDEYLCPFHLPVERTDDDAVVAAFVRALDDGPVTHVDGRAVHQFPAAVFGAFDLAAHADEVAADEVLLSHARFEGPVDCSGMSFAVPFLSLRGVSFEAACSFAGTEFAGAVNLSDAVFDAGLDADGARFAGDLSLRDATVRDGVGFADAAFDGEPVWSDATVAGRAGVRGATFRDRVTCKRTTFGEDAGFSGTQFAEGATFSNAAFEGDASFTRAEFEGEAGFRYVTVGGTADFSLATLSGDAFFYDATFEDVARFQSTAFDGTAVFRDGTFAGETDFGTADFGPRTEFHGADFDGGATFEGAALAGASFADADAHGVGFERADLEAADFADADLAGATVERARLGDAILAGADLSGAALAGARVDGAVVDTGTVFDRHGDGYCRYDPASPYGAETDGEPGAERLRKARATYDTLAALAGENGLPTQASAFRSHGRRVHRRALARDGTFPRVSYRVAQVESTLERADSRLARLAFWLVLTAVWVGLLVLLLG